MSTLTNNKYPEFEPDQLLTNEHLNNLFGYLDEGARHTRTRLIGIGIVCGLEARVEGNSIVITKGCGVTSEGYLVTLEEDATYTHVKTYNPLTEDTYAPFLNAEGTAGAFTLNELKKAATEEGTSALTTASWTGKLVVLFVELLAEGAKNCDPSSCDDKGTTVTVSFRPLLVDKNTTVLTSGVPGATMVTAAAGLPTLRMPRYDVPATPLMDAASILGGYRKILSAAFLQKAQTGLTAAYNAFRPLVQDVYPANPFGTLAADHAFLHNDDLEAAQLINLQYYYDLFSDLMLAHEELRQRGNRLLAICCPDTGLFPRHLVLGEATGGGFRHRFVPSPALSGEGDQVTELRLLFRRMVLLTERFKLPPSFSSPKAATKAGGIRITPSQWGTEPLSERAIPFYYDVAQGAPKLFEVWSAERARIGQATQTLSYHAQKYNTTDEAVTEPLRYDLEPYDFLRIEGHIGQKMPKALASILRIKQEARLPFDVVALSADVLGIRRAMGRLTVAPQAIEQRGSLTNAAGIRMTESARTTTGSSVTASAAMPQTAASKNGALHDCHIQDLEALYDTMRAELECILCSEMQYFYNVEPGSRNAEFANALAATGNGVPTVPLLRSCAPAFRYRLGTLGHVFEALWPTKNAKPYESPGEGLATIEAMLAMMEAQGGGSGRGADAIGVVLALSLLYYIEKLWEVMPSAFSAFNADTFAARYEDLMQVADVIKELIDGSDDKNGDKQGGSAVEMFKMEDVIDHLDALLYACKAAPFAALHREYLMRLMRAMLRQRFGFFAHLHPGVTHKAGVPVGGTFILVYHEDAEEEDDDKTTIGTVGDIRDVKAEFVGGMTFGTRNNATNSLKAIMAERMPGFFRSKAANEAARVVVETKPVNETHSSTGAGSGAATPPPAVPPAAAPVNVEEVISTTSYPKGAQSLMAGDAKAQAYLEAIAAARRRDGERDETILDLLDEIPDGTVIADFCLPYLCCSDCPPMQFVLAASGGRDGEEENEEPQQEGCPPLADILKSFEAFGIDGEEIRKRFEEAFGDYDKVRELFKQLADVDGKAVGDQIHFFTSSGNDAEPTVIARIGSWLQILFKLSQLEIIRMPALQLYGLLLRLLLYVDCITRTSTGKALAAITRLLSTTAKHIAEWEAQSGQWTPGEKSALQAIKKLLDARPATGGRVFKPS